MGSKEFTKNSAAAMANFERMVSATRAFNIQSVKMNNAVDQFATKLERGQVGLQSSWKIWRQEAKGGAKMLDDLAARQTRLLKSTFIPDSNMTGYSKAITATHASMAELGAQSDFAKIRASALNSVMREVGTGMVNFGKNTQWAGRQLTVGLTVPLAVFAQSAAKIFREVDTELTRMQRMYGTGIIAPSTQEIDTVSKKVMALSETVARNMGIAQSETVKAAAEFSAVGLMGDKLINATEQAMRLSKLGAVNAETSQRTIVSLQTVFKVGNQDLKQAVDFFNNIQKQTSTDIQDLTDAIPRVGPIIDQLGGSYKDAAVMMVAMKEAGIPAAQSANAIKSSVASMIGPTKQARDEFEKYGISLTKIKDDTQGNPIKMFEELQTSLKNLSPLVQAQLIEKLFGKFQFARVTALLDNLGRVGSQTQNAFMVAHATTSELANLADQEMKVATESVSARYDRAIAGLKANLVPIGKKFTEGFIALAHVVDTVVKGFKKISDFLGPISKFFGGLATKGLVGLMIVGPVTMLVGLFVNLAGQIFKIVNFSRMFKQGMMDGGLKGAIAGISNYFTKVDLSVLAAKENTDLFKDSVISTADAFAALTANVEKLKIQLSYIAGTSLTGLKAPIASLPQNPWSLTPSMPPSAKGKMGGFVRPHMYPGSVLRQDWESMSPAEQAKYPNLMMAQSAMKPGQFSGPGGYLERGLTAQWKVAPKGVPALANSIYGSEVPIYGGTTGVTKQEMLTKGTQGLIQKHNAVILGLEKADALTTAQLQDLFGSSVVKQSELSTQQIVKLEKVLDTVIFEENIFKQNMVDHLIQEQALILSAQETGTTTNVDILIGKLNSATQMEEAKRVPAITMAWEQFNATLTQAAMAEITRMRERMMMQMAGMKPGPAAMLAAEEQTAISMTAERMGMQQMGLATAQDSSMLRQTIAMNTGKMPRFATGGYVSGPGGPKDDKIPAMLSEGEYVIKASSVNKYGRGTLDALNNGFAAGGLVFANEGYNTVGKGTFAHMQENLTVTEEQVKAFGRYVETHGTSAMKEHWKVAKANGFKGLRAVGNLGFDISGPINSALPKAGVPPEVLVSDLNKRYYDGRNPYKSMLQRIGITDATEIQKLSSALHAQVVPQLASMSKLGLVRDADLYRVMPNIVESTLVAGGYKAHIKDLYAMESMRLGRTPAELAKTLGLSEKANLRGTQFRVGKRFAQAERMGVLESGLAKFVNRMRYMRMPLAEGGKIPAMLSNGEYVMSKEAVDKHGSGFIDGINSGTAKLARGGRIGNRFANSPMNLAGGGILHAALGINTRQAAGMRAYSEAVQPMNRAEIRAMSGMGANAAGVNEARLQRALAAQEQAMAQFGMTVRETAASWATQIKAGTMVAGSKFSDTVLRGGIAIQQKSIQASEAIMSSGRIFKTEVATAGAAAGFGNPSRSTQKLFPTYQEFRNRGMDPARAKEAAQRYQSMYGPTQIAKGKLSGIGTNIKSSLSMKNMSMGKMMGGMIAGQAIGQGLTSLAGNMEDGMGKSAVSGAAQGVQLGAMFGPWGVAIGAGIGALGGAAMKGVQEMRERMKNAKAGLLDAVSLDTVSIERFGLKLRTLGGFVLDATGSIGKAQTELQKSIDAWKASTDPTVQAALKNLTELTKDVGKNKGEISNLAKDKYLTDIQAGMSSKDAKNDIQGYLMAGGVGGMTASGILNNIVKQSNRSKSGAFSQILTTASQLDPSTRYDSYDRGEYKGSMQGASNEVVSKAISTAVTSGDPQKFAASLDEINKKQGSLNETMTNSDSVFKKYQEDLKKTNPDLASLNQTLKDHGAKASSVYKIDTLVSLGWSGNAAAAENLTAHTQLLNQTIQEYSIRTNAADIASKFVTERTTAAAKADTTAEAATKAKTDALNDQIEGWNTYITAQQKVVTQLENQKNAQLELNKAEVDSASNAGKLAELQSQIDAARASGDLVQLTLATQAYNDAVAEQAQAQQEASDTSFYDKQISQANTKVTKAQGHIDKINGKIKILGKTTTSNLDNMENSFADISTHATEAGQVASDFYEGGKWTDKKSFVDGLTAKLSGEFHMSLSDAHDLADKMAGSFETLNDVDFDADGGLNKQITTVSDALKVVSDSASGAFIQMTAFSMLRQQIAAHPGATAKQIKAWAAADVKAAEKIWKKSGGKPPKNGVGAGNDGGGDVKLYTPEDVLPGGAIGALHFQVGDRSYGHSSDYIKQPDGTYREVLEDNKLGTTYSNFSKWAEGVGKGGRVYSKTSKGWQWADLGNGNKLGTQHQVPKKAKGGLMSFADATLSGVVRGPGGPTSDMIPAMLSNGEYVVKASAVGTYGVSMLDAINNKKFDVAKVNNIPTSSIKNTDNSALTSNPVYNITVNAATNADPDEIARVVMKTISSDTRTLSVARRIGATG